MSEEELQLSLEKSKLKIETLEKKVILLEEKIRKSLPQTKILSEKFLTRAFAIYGHTLVAGLIIAVPIWIIAIIIVVMMNVMMSY
jgi:hypothetical protein